ncbi:hypothetical protein OEZ85_014270 [Tetradesmus obliquus]|uniref:AP2/ERF domain-containing protein n=1 Tax=Tetradesmus obliquus TaxID=3088 RepID=A0ABY8UAK7_TETOB|nr:hypothetical protein OEZ85_014270 [Tetradesmus obliquus]
MAERKWQAYVVDHALTEVVWLSKYGSAAEAAAAHDQELLRRLGPEAAPHLNFPLPAVAGSSDGAADGSRGAAALDAPAAPAAAAPAGAAGTLHAAEAAAVVPTSSFKGVEYLPAEKQWQAYVLDKAISEVVWLSKYGTAAEAAAAHDQELLRRLGPAAAAPHLNFPLPAAPGSSSDGPADGSRGAGAASGEQAAAAAGGVLAGLQQQQQQQQQQKAGLDSNSSALAALAQGPAMAAAMAAAAAAAGAGQLAGTDAFVQQIAQAAAAAAAAAAGAAAAAAAGGEGMGPGSKRRKRGGNAAAAGGAGGRGRGAKDSGSGDGKKVSQYKGVSWSHSCAKWVAVIWDRTLRKARHLGVFEEEQEAARAYDREVVKLQGAKNTGLNFRDSFQLYQAELSEAAAATEAAATGIDIAAAAAAADPGAASTAAAEAAGAAAAVAAEAAAAVAKPHSSSYRGVSWHERSKRWEARAWGGGKQHFVGSFTSELDAARAYDKAILKLGGTGPKSASRLNFPLGDYSAADLEQLALPGTAGSSKVQQ